MSHRNFKSKVNKQFNAEYEKLQHRKYSICKGTKTCVKTSHQDTLLSKLQEEKGSLNEVKSLLNSFNIIKWHKHTKNTHAFSLLPYVLHRTIKAELPTQAWAKFYAILCNFDLVKDTSVDVFKSAHLCEAPGAFVSSLNHFLQCKFRSLKWEWTATTLNPYYEGNQLGQMIPDDRFLVETFANWDFGCDFTGNIMSIENLNHFNRKFKNQNIQLVTADGSIDCSDNPDEQEATVALLLSWETIQALSILSNGGSFVLKTFTIFERFTVVLLYLLSQVFEKVSLFKPGPSKPGNSEVYVISEIFNYDHCMDLKLFSDFKDCVLKGNLSDLGDILHSLSISDIFMQSVLEYSQKSCAIQKEAIQNNIQVFEKLSQGDRKNLHQKKQYFANKFIKEMGIVRIENYVSTIFVMKSIHVDGKTNNNHTYLKEDSFDQRKVSNKGELAIQIGNDQPEIKVFWYTSTVFSQPQNVFTTGKKIIDIHSSTICKPSLLKLYKTKKISTSCCKNSMLEIIKILEISHKIEKVDIFLSNTEVKEFLVDFFKENRISVQVILPDSCSNVSNADYLFCHLGNLFSAKVASLQVLKSAMECIQPCQTLVLIFDEILLTNFWLGMFYFMSCLFHKSMYFAPGYLNGCLYLTFDQYTSKQQISKELLNYITSILEYLEKSADDDVDILHVVPVNVLMQSDFRDFINQCNEYFLTNYLL